MIIQFIDKNGAVINKGDWLKILCRSFGNEYTVFYAQFGMTKKGAVVPHDTFAWESVEKIEKKDIPETASKNKTESEYEFYYHGKEEGKDTGQHLSFIIEFDSPVRRKAFKIVEF